MMKEQDCTFTSGELVLEGTLALPDSPGPHPAAVFITGSGQVDRNENHAKMAINTFNELAGHLAACGIASFRYDKRGVGASQGDFYTCGFHDNVKDARSAFNYLAARQKIDPSRVFVIGHSEGAVIASRLAGTGLKTAGIVLLAGTAQPGEDVLMWQAEQIVLGLKGVQGWLIRTLRIDPLKAQRKTIAKIKASTKDTFRMQLIAKINAKWMREFLAYDPSVDLANVICPVLAITGEHDVQVNPSDIARMAALVRTDFNGVVVPGVSHLLREGEPGINDYKRQLVEPIDERVVKLVLDWLEKKSCR